jgi:two-component system, OmpR family, phosphate regulon sensor histidine kinase PhoR
MSEKGRPLRHWRRSHVVAAALAALAVVLTAAMGGSSSFVAGFAAVLFLCLGLFAAFQGGKVRAPLAAAPPLTQPGQLPEGVRATLEQVADPVLVLDPTGRVVFANRASHAIAGTDAERKHISAVLRTPEVLEAIARVTASGAAEEISFSIPVPTPRYFQVHLARTADTQVFGTAILVQIRDVTAIRRAEEMRADFIANASHELRTPLAAVSGFVDTLRGHAKNDPAAREKFLEIMSVEAGRMRRLIDDLLSLARIELNEHNPPSGEADLVSLARSAAEALSPLAAAEGATVDVAAEEPLVVTGERDELARVFHNLIHNAIKYGRPGGRIKVRFGRTAPRGFVFACVEDEGEGIPSEAIPRLTERFYRVDVKRSRERGGTGLGLAIVKHILNRHRGRLQIESTPGQGSTFTVFLPALKEPMS